LPKLNYVKCPKSLRSRRYSEKEAAKYKQQPWKRKNQVLEAKKRNKYVRGEPNKLFDYNKRGA